jgi:hypothetical protein
MNAVPFDEGTYGLCSECRPGRSPVWCWRCHGRNDLIPDGERFVCRDRCLFFFAGSA